MPDFIVLPPFDDNHNHFAVRMSSFVSFDSSDTNPSFEHYTNAVAINTKPRLNWFVTDDLSIRLIGNGTKSGAESFLLLGRPGDSIEGQLHLGLAKEVPLNIPVEFLKNNPSVNGLFFGSILDPSLKGTPVSNIDLLTHSTWMAKMNGKLVEAHDPTQTYEGDEFDIYELLVITEFGKNDCYLITSNPSIIKVNTNIAGVCPKTGSKFTTLSNVSKIRRLMISNNRWSDNCQPMPNRVFPTHIIVDGDSFTVDLHDMLRDSYGITTGPNVNIISNIPYTRNDNILKFDFTNKSVGVINFELELGRGNWLQFMGQDLQPFQVLTIVRK